MRRLLISLLACFGFAGGVWAHETTRSYLTLTRDGADMTAVLRIAFRDIEVAVWIDEDLDGQITWDETTRRLGAVSDYVTSALTIETTGPCQLVRSHQAASQHSGLAYLDLTYQVRCQDPQAAPRVTSRLFAESDPDHRMFLTADTVNTGGAPTATLLGPGENAVVLSDDAQTGPGGFVRYFNEGVRHLLQGADHLVFLLVLVLPAAASRSGSRKAILDLLTAVTGFTVAHALTLTAAATSLLRPPSALIEILIALSIVITAIDNLRPFIPAPRSAVAAFFGLIHGFGFASALGGLPLSGPGFVAALVGFNLGIEAAQIAVLLVLLPALIFLGQFRGVLQGASLCAAVAGIGWIGLRLPF